MIRRQPQASRRSGVILFVVVMIIALAALAAYTFVVAVQGDSKAARLTADQLQTEQVAASGEAFVTTWLAQPRSQRDFLREEYEVFAQAVTQPSLTAASSSANSLAVGHFYIVQPITMRDLTRQDANRTSGLGSPVSRAPARVGSMGGSQFNGIGSAGGMNFVDGSPWQLGVVNESSKLHLATLLMWEQAWPGSARNALLQLPGMTMEIADAILDWIDKDSEPREFGAEESNYLEQARPYAPANRVPDSLEELLLVRGVTRGRLFGDEEESVAEGSALSTSVSAGNPIGSNPFNHANGNPAGGIAQPWSRFLTVHSAERNEMFEGQPRINVNSKDLVELHDELEQQVSLAVANFVVLYRQLGPVSKSSTSNTDADKSDPDGEYESADAADIDFGTSATQKLQSAADLLNAIVQLPPEDADDPDEKPRYVRSPLSLESLADPELAVAFDALTTVNAKRPIVGRLNLYDAPIQLLAALPLLEPGQAEQIAAARDTADPVFARQGLGWLVESGTLAPTAFRAIVPYLTLGGDVVSFQVIGSHGQRTLYHRYAVTMDGTLRKIRRVEFRDLRRHAHPNMFDTLPRPNETQGSGFTGPTSASPAFAPR